MPQTARMHPHALVGRDAPLARLRAALDRGGGAVFVRGEPGIGKTRLVDALARDAAARGLPVLTGRADPDDGAPPLWPWLQALAGRPERSRLVALAAPLPETVDPADATRLGHAARLLAFDAVLDGLAATPCVVVLEDLHWADEPTLRLVTLAADRPGLLVVATYRDTEESPALRATVADLRRRGTTELVTLRPWDDAAVAALLPANVHPSWGPVLRRTGAGLPLLVTALLQDLLDTDRAAGPAPPDGRWPLAAPERLVDLTDERLARLDPAARRAVEIVAVSRGGLRARAPGQAGRTRGRGRGGGAGGRCRRRAAGPLPRRGARLRAAAAARLEAGEAPLPVLAALAQRLPGAPPDRAVTTLRATLAPDAPDAADVRPPRAACLGLMRPATAANGRDGELRARWPGSTGGSVAALADALGCTPRSVHRRCLAAFGYGPAVVRRVLRFRLAAALLHAGLAPAEVAARAGYADQPHLSREVRTLAGASPCQLASGANRSTPLPSGSCSTA